MNLIKTYYPVFISAISWFFAGIGCASTIYGDINANDNVFLLASITLILVLLAAVASLILKIVYTVDVSKRFTGAEVAVWSILIWFADVYILGHYNFLYMQNRKDIKTFVLFYIISLIASFVFGMVSFKMLI